MRLLRLASQMLPEKESCLYIPTVAPVTSLGFPPQNGLGNSSGMNINTDCCGSKRGDTDRGGEGTEGREKGLDA